MTDERREVGALPRLAIDERRDGTALPRRSIDRELAERVFRDAVAACDPTRAVAASLARDHEAGPIRVGVAIGKAGLAMARGAGPVARGLVVTIADDGRGLPAGWQLRLAGHPLPDERSVAAGQAVRAVLASAAADERVVVLISGGASALVEVPRCSLAELRAITKGLMAAGASIHELNTVRAGLSELKAGQLASACAAPLETLAISDVIGDRLEVIGSGPTIPARRDAEQRRVAAVAVLESRGLAVPDVLRESAAVTADVRSGDRAELVLGMAAFAEAATAALVAAGVPARLLAEPIRGEPEDIAERLAAELGVVVAWGEPAPRLPADAGEGGRAQQLALELARRLRGHERAALVAGSDGIDGPPPRGRPAPAGAYVDGGTWDALVDAGVDPQAHRARFDAGTALATIGALFVTGPTGVNHADLVVIG
jgi:glycerate 2-kinase